MSPNSGATCEKCGAVVSGYSDHLCVYCETFTASHETTNACDAPKPTADYKLMSMEQLFKSLYAITTELNNTMAAIRVSQFGESLEHLNDILNEVLDERQKINEALGHRQRERTKR